MTHGFQLPLLHPFPPASSFFFIWFFGSPILSGISNWWRRSWFSFSHSLPHFPLCIVLILSYHRRASSMPPEKKGVAASSSHSPTLAPMWKKKKRFSFFWEKILNFLWSHASALNQSLLQRKKNEVLWLSRPETNSPYCLLSTPSNSHRCFG